MRISDWSSDVCPSDLNHDAAAAGDHEAVTTGVIGTRGTLRRGVVLRRQRAHGVEQHRHGPVQLLAAAGEHDVLLAELDRLHGVADAVRTGRAGRADRSEEHTSELQSLMRISYAVFCLKKKNNTNGTKHN